MGPEPCARVAVPTDDRTTTPVAPLLPWQHGVLDRARAAVAGPTPVIPRGRPLRVVVVHNRYVSANPSGENEVVDTELQLLKDAGVYVRPYIRSSDEIAQMNPMRRAAGAIRPIRSGEDLRRVDALIDEVRPDVVHLHNPYPLISPMVIRTSKRRGVAVVQTVHNQRHICMAGTFSRDGHDCYECVGRVPPLPGVRHGCYRGSRPQSLVMATSLSVHRPTFRLVDRFLAL